MAHHVMLVAGARPNFIKVAPVMRALEARGTLRATLVHTGQHYDEAMSGGFFRTLGIPEPDVNLNVGSASHAVQTARIMERFEPVLDASKPACIVVFGDVNSTAACVRVIFSDSGGIQEEASHLDVPCLTLRPNTERPITVELGTSTLVGNDPAAAIEAWLR